MELESAEKNTDCKKENVICKVPDDLRFAPDSVRSDRIIVLKVVKSCPSAFVYASDELQNDRKFVKQAVNINADVIKYVSDKFKNDKSIALIAVRKNGGILPFLSEQMQDDVDVIEASFGGKLFKMRSAPERIRDNKEFAIKALSMYGWLLEFLTERLRADKDVVTAAVGSAWNALGFASEELRGDRDVVLAAVKHDGYALQFASDELKDDKEIVLTAIDTHEGNVLCYVSERLRHDGDVIRAVLDAHPGQFENLPADVQEDLDYILFGLESVVRNLPVPDDYSFFKDSISEYYTDFAQSEVDFLDIFESIPVEVLADDPDFNDKVCRLAVELNSAYYKEGNYPFEDVHDGIIRSMAALYEEYGIPASQVLKDAIEKLRRESAEKKDEKYGSLDPEKRSFYETLDLYEIIVGRSATKYGAENEREYLSPDGGFVKNCMRSFVKDLVYSRSGLYHESVLWNDDGYEVDLDKAYKEISSRLSPKMNVVRNANDCYYSENVTVELTGGIQLIIVRALPHKIMEIWVNKIDSGHEHGKWLAPDRLSEFCDMAEHICGVYGEYRLIAEQRAAELRDIFGL